MDVVKKRFGNLVAWIGFISLLLGPITAMMTHSGVLWEVFIQDQPMIEQNECANWKKRSELRADTNKLLRINDASAGFRLTDCVNDAFHWSYGGNTGWIYPPHGSVALNEIRRQIPGYSFTWRSLWNDLLGLLVFFSSLWLFILTTNYVFWDRFRIFPWKLGGRDIIDRK